MVSRIFERGSKALSSQQHTIMSAATVIGLIYLFSAFLGFIRNRLLSGYFGDSPELGVYFAADDIPNLLFSLIVSGSLSAAFIPVFTKYYKKSKDEAWAITSSVLNLSLVLFFVLALCVMFGADFIARETVARNSGLSEVNLILLAKLMRVMMLAQILFIISAFFTSILQSFNRFIIPALAPVLYNLGVIIFILLFTPRFGVFAPAYGMIFGAFLHLGTQFPLAKQLGFKYQKVLNIRNMGVREMYKLMAPRTIGQIAQKFMVPFYTNLALFISAPSNVILTFAEDIQAFPVRIFGMSIGQAALPILSKAYNNDDPKRFRDLLIKTIQQVIYFILPASVLLFVLRVPLVRLTVGAQKYSWKATIMTAYAVGFFSISLVAQSMVLILSRAFYASRDTKTPVIISVFSLFVNGMFAYFFVRNLGLGVWSLALAYAIGSIINATVLFVFLIRKIGSIDIVRFLGPINKMGFATLAMGVALYVPLKALDQVIFDTTRTIWLIVLTAIVSTSGVLTYFGLSWGLKIKELNMAISVYNRVKKFLVP